MRVAIEAASLSLTSGGLARYTSELSLALGRTFPEDEFYLISDQPFAMPAPANLLRGGGPRNTAERRWWLWGMARELSRLHADVIHGPDFAVPYLARRPSVLTLHDLSPWMDERWHHAAQRVRRRTPLLLDLGLATMVITPGEKVRRAAIERFRLQPIRWWRYRRRRRTGSVRWRRRWVRRRIFYSWARWNRARTWRCCWKRGASFIRATRWI